MFTFTGINIYFYKYIFMNVEFAFDRDQFTNELMLPSNISASDSKQINKLHIKFGDIFKPEEPSIIVITDVLDGVLFRLFSLKNGNITNLHTYNNLEYLRSMRVLESKLNNIPYVVAIKNNPDTRMWTEMFEEIASKLVETYGDEISQYNLIFPPIGTNNGIRYNDCAIGLFNGILNNIINNLEDKPTNLNKFNKICVLTVWSDNHNNTSCRVINHMFNLIKIKEQTINERDCLICCSNKINIILKCGHYIMCKNCLLSINDCCPICKIELSSNKILNRDFYECYKFNDKSDYKCCEFDEHKQNYVYVPCGHANVNCNNCINKLKDHCPICNKKSIAIKYYT